MNALPSIGRAPLGTAIARPGSSAIPRWLVPPHDAGRILDDAAHAAAASIALEDRVRVDTADVAVAGDVQAGVQRVGLPAVRLVDDHEVRMVGAAVDAPDLRRREDVANEHLVRLERKLLAKALERLVGRPVVYDDDLELRILEPEQRVDRRYDPRLLVVRRDDDTDRDGEAGYGEPS